MTADLAMTDVGEETHVGDEARGGVARTSTRPRRRPRDRRTVSSLLALGALLLVTAGAPRAAAQTESAAELLDRGVALREEGRDAEALTLFRRAHERSPSGQTLAQVALAEQAVGRFVLAERDLVAALALGGPWIDSHRGTLEAALETIRAQLGQLVLAGGVDGAEVEINGRRVGVLPLEPQSVQAGLAVVAVTAPDHLPFRRQVEITAGQRTRQQVVLVPRPEVEASPEEAPDARVDPAPAGPDAGLLAGAVVALAVGGAGLITFGAVGGVALAEHGSVRERCGDAMTCTEGDVSSLRTLSTIADVGLGVGLASAALGAVLLAVALSSSGDGSGAARLEVTPSGLALRGTF